MVLGYKGQIQLEAGIFYCPYPHSSMSFNDSKQTMMDVEVRYYQERGWCLGLLKEKYDKYNTNTYGK